jgi:MFS family permease
MSQDSRLRAPISIAMDPNERKILILTSAAHYLTHFFVLVFPVLVMPISRDLSMEPSAVLTISFPMYLCYGLLAIPWGYLSDRIDARLMMAAGMIIAGVGFLTAGLAESVERLTLCLGVIGVGCSAYHPSGLALLSKGIRVRGRAMGINGLWGNFGIASAPLVAGIFTYAMGWKSTLLAFGLLGVLLGIVCLAVPFSIGRQDLQRGRSVAGRQAVRLFLILCAAMVFSGLMYRGYTVILPTFFESKLAGLGALVSNVLGDARAAPEADTLMATLIACSVYLIGMVGQLLGGRVADRRDLRWAYLTFFVCALPFLLSLRFVEGPFLIPLAGCFVLFSLGMQPIENSLVAMLTPPQWRSVSYGVKFTLVFGAGSLAVYFVSFADRNHGLDGVILLLLFFLAMVISMIAVLLLASRGASVRHEHG